MPVLWVRRATETAATRAATLADTDALGGTEADAPTATAAPGTLKAALARPTAAVASATATPFAETTMPPPPASAKPAAA